MNTEAENSISKGAKKKRKSQSREYHSGRKWHFEEKQRRVLMFIKPAFLPPKIW